MTQIHTLTLRAADEPRTARHYNRVIGYYARVMPLTTGPRAWRGVTLTGTLVYAATARDVVQALREASTS